MTNQTIIVHGPQGCGKTLNAGRIARAFGLDRVIEDWQPGDPSPPKRGALVLTCETPDPGSTKRYRVMAFDDVMSQITGKPSH